MGGSVRNITWKAGPVFSNNIDCKIHNNFTSSTTLPVAQPNKHQANIVTKAYSGTSKHFIKQNDAHLLTDVKKSTTTSVVLLDKTNLPTTSNLNITIIITFIFKSKKKVFAAAAAAAAAG